MNEARLGGWEFKLFAAIVIQLVVILLARGVANLATIEGNVVCLVACCGGL